MDEELMAYLNGMRREINDGQERVLNRIAFLEDGQERILNRIASLEQDFLNTKGFLVGDAIVSGRRWLDLEERVGRLERDQKNGPQS